MTGDVKIVYSVFMTNLATNIEKLRVIQRLSKKDLAELSGLSSVKMILNGVVGNPRIQNVEAIAKALGVTVAYLYREPTRKKRSSKKRRRKAS